MIATFMTAFGLFSTVVLPYVAFRRMLTKLHAEFDYQLQIYCEAVFLQEAGNHYPNYKSTEERDNMLLKSRDRLHRLMFDIVYTTYPLGFHVSRQIRDEELARLRAIVISAHDTFVRGDGESLNDITMPQYTSYENYATSSNKHRFLFRLTRPATLILYRMWKVTTAYFDLSNRTPAQQTWMRTQFQARNGYNGRNGNGYQPTSSNLDRKNPPGADESKNYSHLDGEMPKENPNEGKPASNRKTSTSTTRSM